jgi:hypothetical protein
MQKHQIKISFVILFALISTFIYGQENLDTKIHDYPLSNIVTQVPEGYSLAYSMSYMGFSDKKSPVLGTVGFGLNSVICLYLFNESPISNMLGDIKSLNSWGAQVQLFPKREQFPSISLWLKSSIGWQGERLAYDQLISRFSSLASQNFHSFSYDYSYNSAGIATEMQAINKINVGLNIGILELKSGDLWINTTQIPNSVSSYHNVIEKSELMFDGSAFISYSPLQNITLIGEIKTLPYFNLDMSSQQLIINRSYVSSLGIRYLLPIPLNVEAYITSQAVNGKRNTQIRIGISGLLNVNID